MAQDYLSELSEERVAGWFRRLADKTAELGVVKGSKEPLAATFMRVWLSNRDPNFTYQFDPPPHLQQASQVRTQLTFHRDVFLTKQKARFKDVYKWAGVLPRIQGLPGFQTWDVSRRQLELQYQSLVQIGSNPLDIERIEAFGTNEERDLFASLHGFQLESSVMLTGSLVAGSSRIRITFLKWSCRAMDRYHWNDQKYLTLPNPDYGSKAADAVRPQDRMITVHHSNQLRLEAKGMAAPFNSESRPWQVSDPILMAPDEVDTARKLAGLPRQPARLRVPV